MSKVLFVLDVPLFRNDGRMAGLQVRTYEMARALIRRGHEVIVGQPPPESGREEYAGLRVVGLDAVSRHLKPDVWISHPLVAGRLYRWLKDVPLVIDGYEFPFASFLAHTASQLSVVGERAMYHYHNWVAEYLTSLKRADRVLCANQNQRIGYLTLLSVLGKLNPRYDAEDLVLTVQSGAPPEPPSLNRASPPSTFPAKERGPVILWAGGCYPWFDVGTYLASLPLILEQVPEARFLFVGIDGVEGSDHGELIHRGAKLIRETIVASQELSSRTWFVDWLPYRQRGWIYLVSDVGICTYRSHLETTFSMRTRIIDMIWGGLPVVSTVGDTMSDYLNAQRIGFTVRPGDPVELAKVIIHLIEDREARCEMSRRARALAEEDLSWDRQIEPLHNFCLDPNFEPSRQDDLVKRTVANVIRVNNGWAWRVQDRSRTALWRAKRALHLARKDSWRALLRRLWSR